MLLHVHETLLCKEVSPRPIGNNNRVNAFGILELELYDRYGYILLGHLVVLHVTFPESAEKVFGLGYAIEGFHVSYKISYELAKVP
jgi:hypothetical protein